MRQWLLLAFLLATLSGCQTIYFEKGPSHAMGLDSGRWHHGGGIFSLVEFTWPYDPIAACHGDDWQAVRVDHTFPTALVSALVPLGIYTPWETAVRCGDRSSAL